MHVYCGLLYIRSGGRIALQDKYEAFELLPMLLVGILGGLLGSLFNHLNEKITRWRKQYVTNNRQKMWDAAAVAVLSATLCFILPLTVGCRVRLQGACGTERSSRLLGRIAPISLVLVGPSC